MDPRLRLALSLLAVVLVFAGSTLGYHLLCEVSLGDSAYMTVITLSTVGFEEVVPLDRVGRLWTCLTIILGIGTVSVAFSSLISVVLSGELKELRGRSRMKSRVEHLEKHVIICGGGRMGALTAADLEGRGIPFAVIEREPVVQRELTDRGCVFVEGDATAEETLLAAGLERARAIVAVLPRDSDNLYISLTARGLRADLMIIARAEHPSTEVKLKRAGADRVILPHLIGATKIANILTRPSVVDFFETASAGVDLEVDQYIIGVGSSIANKTLRESSLRQEAGVIVVAIKKADGSMRFSPDPDEVIGLQDTLIMVGQAGASARLDQLGL
ncbi:MAG: potassium channel protein [bacterium]|nr:potassium channel protein [bacterium]